MSPSDLDLLSGALAGALVLALLAVVGLLLQLRRSRRRIRALERQLYHQPGSRAVQAAGWAVKKAVDTAVRVRQHGVQGLLMSSIEDLARWADEDSREIEQVVGPDGTVTVFFSDIEDSTPLNEKLGDHGWVRLLRSHQEMVSSHVARHHGHVVKSQGDGFMVVFREPADAVAAAAGIQRDLAARSSRWMRRTPIKVRIGLHVGRVVTRDGDYFGMNVATAARVAAMAGGGQVLVTDWVRDRVEDREFELYAEQAELRGIPGTHRLWAVAI
jgi:class 3 adenylate cyclase